MPSQGHEKLKLMEDLTTDLPIDVACSQLPPGSTFLLKKHYMAFQQQNSGLLFVPESP